MKSEKSEHSSSPSKISTSILSSSEIRERFLRFFEKRGHTIIPSASLVTPDEKGITNATLFNTAGMQPLVPYLLGKPYLAGNPPRPTQRLADSQKCIRTIDIDEVGDATHATFFEMLGNWSLGDYFKKEAITWSYEFLTSKSDQKGQQGLGLDPTRLYVTVFAGDKNAPRDTEAADIWKNVGVPEHRIYFKDAASNWWPAVKGEKDSWTGPTGPCSEMFYDITPKGLGDLSPKEFEKAEDDRKIVEIWNDVFMEFEKKDGKITGRLSQKNVDTGAGLERLSVVIQKTGNIYDTDLLKPLMDTMAHAKNELRNKRIIADHLRASVFLIADGVVPSNTDRGYILRRLIRRAVMNTTDKKLDPPRIGKFVDVIVSVYAKAYPYLKEKSALIKNVLDEECAKFAETLVHGLKEFEKGVDAFTLFSSYGFPLELTLELAKEKGITVDVSDFDKKFKAHQELSRAGAEQKFKGGLADASDPMVVRYHTATHLLHQALHDVLGEDQGGQKGSNITPERLRFDFSYGAKLTDEQKRRIEEIVNEKITAALPMRNVIMPKTEAEKTGARHFFGEKYGDQISIYYTGGTGTDVSSDLKTAYSKEFCGGPHVKNTSELAGPEGKWRFKIAKEEAVSAGVRRIKAVLE